MVKKFPTEIFVIGIVFLFFVMAFLILPLVIVGATSLTASDYLVFPPQGLSLKWYAKALQTPTYIVSAWTSLLLALSVMASAMLLGGGAAIALWRSHSSLVPFASAMFLSPLILPTIVIAIGLLLMFSNYFGGPSLFGLWLGHTVLAIPYVVRTTLAVLETSGSTLEEAARTMGASPWQVLWRVTLPRARSGLMAGGFFAFALSFDEAVIALFMRLPGLETLPIRIYGELEYSPTPAVAAVSSMMICLTLLLVLAIGRSALGLKR